MTMIIKEPKNSTVVTIDGTGWKEIKSYTRTLKTHGEERFYTLQVSVQLLTSKVNKNYGLKLELDDVKIANTSNPMVSTSISTQAILHANFKITDGEHTLKLSGAREDSTYTFDAYDYDLLLDQE